MAVTVGRGFKGNATVAVTPPPSLLSDLVAYYQMVIVEILKTSKTG